VSEKHAIMKLNIDRLSEDPSDEVFEVPASWWLERSAEANEYDYEISEPLRFELRSYKMGSRIYLEGIATAEIEPECSRCLARYRHALRDSFRLVVEKAGARVPPDPEGLQSLSEYGMCLSDEIETAWYRGSEIVLDGFFGEVISGAMPIQPLCKENCAGLCASCGAARNSEQCQCEGVGDEPKRESPFAVLAKLRDEHAGGN